MGYTAVSPSEVKTNHPPLPVCTLYAVISLQKYFGSILAVPIHALVLLCLEMVSWIIYSINFAGIKMRLTDL